MSEDTKSEDKPKKSLIWRLIKWTFFFLLFLFIVLTVLTNLGGNSPVLKDAIEDFMTERSGYRTQIGTLNRMTFFPDMSVDVQGIAMSKPDEDSLPITIADAKIAMRFFDVIFGRKAIRGIYITDLHIPAGTASDKTIAFEHIKTIEGEGSAHLEAKGKIGETPVLAKINIQAMGSSMSRYFVMNDKTMTELSLGDLKFVGDVEKQTFGGSKVENVELTLKETQVLAGAFEFERNASKWDLKGAFILAGETSTLSPDLKMDFADGFKASGAIKSESLDVQDVSAKSRFMKSIDIVSKTFGSKDEGYDFANDNVNIDLQIDTLKAGATKIGSISAPLIIQDNILKIAPISGNISGGALDGGITLSAEESPASLAVNIKAKHIDYGAFQRQFKADAEIDGKADLLIKMNASGNSGAALTKGLKGSVSFIGGEGKMRTGLLDLWGGGLLNALLPNFGQSDNLKMNCVVVDFEIEKGIADTKSLFVDTQRVTMTGDGSYDIAKDNLDIKLTPKPKELALGDISSAVIVSGPLSDLSANVSAFGLGKKIGGLLLGAINPAFLAVTFADLGLNDDHPCKAFVIEKEELPPIEPKDTPQTP